MKKYKDKTNKKKNEKKNKKTKSEKKYKLHDKFLLGVASQPQSKSKSKSNEDAKK